MSSFFAWLAVAATVSLTVYGQMVIKWRVASITLPHGGFWDKLLTILALFGDPWVISGVLSALGASVCWMAAMTRLPLTLAYPFTSLSVVLVTFLGVMMLGEAVTLWKVGGVCLVVLGLIVLTR